MALVRKTAEAKSAAPSAGTNTPTSIATRSLDRANEKREAERLRIRARAQAKQQLAERLAATVQQFVAGLADSSAAGEELHRAMEQIATATEQASGASHEAARASEEVLRHFELQSDKTEAMQRKTLLLQELVTKVSGQIHGTVEGIATVADKQRQAVARVTALNALARDIGEVTETVAGVADQTNLLALNAAIEASKAGKHGRGFAVVAAEIRLLASQSEASASEVRDLVGQIQVAIGQIVEGMEQSSAVVTTQVDAGRTVNAQLEELWIAMQGIHESSRRVHSNAQEASVAAQQATRGAESGAGAAQQQAVSCEEGLQTVTEQSAALMQSEQAARDLLTLAEELRNGGAGVRAERLAGSAEEISTSLQELGHAAAQISTALQQISRGSVEQAAAANEQSAAAALIEKGAQFAEGESRSVIQRATAMQSLLAQDRHSVDGLLEGVEDLSRCNRNSQENVFALEGHARRIEKMTDAITLVAIQINMLAVTGAVEAARAAEFGRGFATVSADIKSLAGSALQNSTQVKDVVRQIQDALADVRRSVDEVMVIANAESGRTRSVGAGLADLEKDITVIVEDSQTLLNSAEQISKRGALMRDRVQQIAISAEESEQATASAATAARQQLQAMDELMVLVEEVASMAEELKVQ